ncbi:MAG: glycogen/starch/alpha-glucan phosphorylase [Steroidobacteraceae bacterium]
MDPVAERSLSPATLRRALLDRLTRSLGKDPGTATPRDFYDALSLAVREELTARWLATQRRIASGKAKRVCYLSVEFLPGRSLVNALSSLDGGMVDEARRVLADYGLELDKLAALEVDPGLGNGGLGRLAACFLDSLATLQYPAVGYGIRYDYGIFTQRIAEDGGQRELASTWLRLRNPWEIPRSDARYKIRFGGGANAHEVLAVGFDHLVPGNRSPTVNHLRLWSGRAVVPFRIECFNRGQYADAGAEQGDAKNLSRVLYPDDSTPQGRELRLRQQFFFVSASLQDLLATHLAEGRSLEELPRCVAIQLNDTHPALAIAELLRLLVDEHGLDWDRARLLGEEIFGYTNHTLLPEALETWPVEFFERLLPRHLQIIYLINRDFLASVEAVDPGNHELRRRVSIIDEEHGRQVRMSHLAVIGSRRVNGVARLHSRLMRDTIFSDFAALLPGRFTNVTNGIATRRWLKQSNPGLTSLLTEHLGHAWENDLEELSRLGWALDDPDFLQRFRDIKRDNKRRLAEVVAARTGLAVDPDSMFDVQVKRIHEYKRQTLNLLSVVARYLRIRDGERSLTPRTVLFAGKAAPGYVLAKTLIRVINLVARTVNADPATRGLLRVAFLPDYDVSLAQQIMPAADLSQQISTAGMEASGTGNMKLALNGALTMGTLDGANIEIAEAVGRDQLFIFGLDAEGVVQRRQAGYVPMEFVTASPELAAVLEALASGELTGGNGDEARPLVDRLLGDGEPYLVLADFHDYQRAQAEADRLFLDQQDWTRRAAANTLAMGPFSSDRSIREYAGRIWGLEPLT